MKTQSIIALKVILAGALCLASTSLVRAEEDASSGISISNGTMTASGGTIVFSNFTANAGAVADAVNQHNTGLSPVATATSTYSTGTGNATIPPTISFNVNGAATATTTIAGFTPGTSTATGTAGASGFFTVTGGTGPVTIVFSIPIVGFTSTHISGAGDITSASDSLTLSLLTLGGTSIMSQMFSVNSGTVVGSPGSPATPNTVSDTVILNYNQQYQVNLLASAVTSVTNVPEPTTTSLLVLGLVSGSVLLFRRKVARKNA